MAGFSNDASNNQIMYADNVDFSGDAIPEAKVLQNGQLLIGSAVAPNIRVNTLTAGAGVTITNGNGTITIGLTGGGTGIDTVMTDDGASVTPNASGVINLFSTATNGIETTGSGNTATVSMATPYADGDFEFRSATSGATRTLSVTNTSNTASSQAKFTTSVAGSSAGDTWIEHAVGSARAYAQGIDNSDSDKLKLTTAAAATANPSTATPAWSLEPTVGFNYDNSGTTSFGIGFNTNPDTNYSVKLLKTSLNGSYGVQAANTNNGNASAALTNYISDTASASVGVYSSTYAAATPFQNRLVLNADTGSTGILLNSGASGAIYFYSNAAGGVQAAQLDPTNGMQVNLTQALTSNGNLTVKGNGAGTVLLTTGARFGAGTDTMSVYDEGTWTPTLTGSTTPPDTITYSSQVAQFTQIGRLVTFTATVAVATFTLGAGAGNLTLSGLPVTVNATLGGLCTISLEGVDIAATAVMVVGQIIPNTVTLRFLEVTDNGAATFVPLSALAAGDTVRVSGFYNA